MGQLIIGLFYTTFKDDADEYVLTQSRWMFFYVFYVFLCYLKIFKNILPEGNW